MHALLSSYTPPCTLEIKVSAGASKTECIEKMSDGTLKMRVAAVREDGKANKELLRYLAKEFGVKKSQVVIISGEMNERKVVGIATC